MSTSKLKRRVEQSKSPTISFIQLNLDVLISIASHLDVISIARLCQVNHFLNKFVEDHGWKAWCITGQKVNIHRSDIISSKVNSSLSSSSSYKHLIQVDQAWESKTFRSYQSHLPFAIRRYNGGSSSNNTNNGKERFERHPPQPLLLLVPLGLILFTGSEMRFWTKDILQSLDSVQLDQAQIFYLTNPAGLDKQSSKNGIGGGGSFALWDICACTQLDRNGHYIAIGRLNGLVEIIRLSKTARGGKYQTRQKERGKVMLNLVWVWRDVTCSTSIQSMHASTSSGLLAVAGKNGNIALFNLTFKSNNIQVNMVEHWNISSRPWSIWLEGSKWLAIGTNGSSPIILFTLDQKTLRPSEGVRLSTGSNSKWTSVYAMKTKIIVDECYLLAGCYDGTLRTYNVDRAFSDENCSSSKYFLPISQHRDRFDPSAIYCLAIDVGENGQEVAAGTARHGVCKFFNQQSSAAPNREKDQGWSIFATSAQSSESPTYSLVGQFDRLFGVTDAVFWQLDLRPSSRLPAADGKKDEHQNTMAYYRHGDMIIDHTRWPSN